MRVNNIPEYVSATAKKIAKKTLSTSSFADLIGDSFIPEEVSNTQATGDVSKISLMMQDQKQKEHQKKQLAAAKEMLDELRKIQITHLSVNQYESSALERLILDLEKLKKEAPLFADVEDIILRANVELAKIQSKASKNG